MDGIKYCEGRSDEIYKILADEYDLPEFHNGMPIDDVAYQIANNAYQYAMDMTEREVHQAVEGMYHNLK